MGWQEEVAAEMQSKQTKFQINEEERKNTIFAFWEKLRQMNASLLPELQMIEKKEGNNIILNGVSYYIKFNIFTHVKGTNQESTYYIQAHNSKGEVWFSVNNPANALCCSCTYEYDGPEIFFRIQPNTPEILIKNLCMNKVHPSNGLEKFDFNKHTGTEKTIIDKISSFFN